MEEVRALAPRRPARWRSRGPRRRVINSLSSKLFVEDFFCLCFSLIFFLWRYEGEIRVPHYNGRASHGFAKVC